MYLSLAGALAVIAIAFAQWCLARRFCQRPVKNAHRVLLIIAHPDDECMFFGPCILNLLEEGAEILVLCLSSGNFYKQGLRRKVELRHSCQVLGIPLGNIIVIDHTKLLDDPTCFWNKGIIKHIVLRYIEQLGIDTVVTFDDGGVSGHINHRSLYRAIQHMYSKAQLPSGTQIIVLESINLPRKYMSFVDLPISSLSATYVYISSFGNMWRAQKAMFQHRTQLTWYRVLYIIFSRYMIINTLRRIRMEDHYYKYDNKSS